MEGEEERKRKGREERREERGEGERNLRERYQLSSFFEARERE